MQRVFAGRHLLSIILIANNEGAFSSEFIIDLKVQYFSQAIVPCAGRAPDNHRLRSLLPGTHLR
jgi:hypothetical protein